METATIKNVRPAGKRYESLDALRGLTVMLMLIVNNPGRGGADNNFAQLRHAGWNGFTLTDFVFPSFLFCVGAAIWFAYRKTDHRLTWAAFKKISIRAVNIFLVGIGLSLLTTLIWKLFRGQPIGWDILHNLRLTGVFPRIALCFWLGSVLCLSLKSYAKCSAAAALMLIVYWAVVLIFGGTGRTDYIGNVIDRAVFGETHIYGGEGGFDPEGLLSCLPATVNVILGYIAAKILGTPQKENGMHPLAWLFGIGALIMIAGIAMSPLIPLNKKIWTPSYALLTSGLSMLCWCALAGLLDFNRPHGGKPLLDRWRMPVAQSFGCNALALYCGGVLLALLWNLPMLGGASIHGLWFDCLCSFLPVKVASLCYPLTALDMLLAVPAVLMHRHKIYIKL